MLNASLLVDGIPLPSELLPEEKRKAIFAFGKLFRNEKEKRNDKRH
jgi:hypothetical protein